MQVPQIGALQAARPTSAAFRATSREEDPQDRFAPGQSPAPAGARPAGGTPLTLRTYVPIEGGYREVRQFPAPERLRMTRTPEGRARFVFVNDEGLHSVLSGGRVEFVHPVEGKLRGLEVHPEDGRVFAWVGDSLEILDAGGRLLEKRAVPPETRALLMASSGGVYLSTDSSLQKLEGGPALPLGGAAGAVAELPGGHTVVREWQQGVVRVFDPSGREAMATPPRASQVSLSPEGRLVYACDREVHSYDVATGRAASFRQEARNLFPLRDGRIVAHVESDLTRADLLVLGPDGAVDKKFSLKGGSLMDLQEAPDGRSLLGTVNRWHRKPSGTDLVRFDLEGEGLGARLGELLRSEHGQTVVHSVPEREGLVAGVLPDGGVVVVEKRGAFLNGRPVGDHAALEARLGRGARLFRSENLLAPRPDDLDAAFRQEIAIRPQAELGAFYREQGGVASGRVLEFPGERVERLPGHDWAARGKEAVVKSLLAVERNAALQDGVLAFPGPGGAVLRTSAHELVAELPLGDGKFRSLSFVCDWDDLGGGTVWEESWTHALPVQVADRHYLCAANDKNQVFFIDLAAPTRDLKHVTLDSPVRSVDLSAGQVVVSAEDGTTLVIDPPRGPGETVHEGAPPVSGSRVIESQQRVMIGGIVLRKK